jgi:hypothetical protein
MSWAATFTDDGARLRRIRQVQLQGERDSLQHRRDMLRLSLAAELQKHCRDGARTPKAAALEEELRHVAGAWMSVVNELRELQQSQRDAA